MITILSRDGADVKPLLSKTAAAHAVLDAVAALFSKRISNE